MNLIITTYPKAGSANVGDLLITESFVALARYLRVLNEYEVIFRERELTDDLLEKYGSAPIFLPGFSIAPGAYPRWYKLRKNLQELPPGLIPFGCSWQHPLGYEEHAEKVNYTETMQHLLRTIADRTGPIAVRDHLAQRILMRHSIPSIVVGDCAWYHLPSRGKPMRRPEEIRKIVVTTPHAEDLADQSIAVIDMLQGLFPNATVAVSFHSKLLPHDRRIAEYARSKGLGIIRAFKDVGFFEKYKKFDLHVGHRLHGHIGFLRRRIPSVLFIEDARSRGFSTSIPVGCFEARGSAIRKDVLATQSLNDARKNVFPDEGVVQRVRDFLAQEIQSQFLRYVGVAPYLDTMLDEFFLPQLAEKVVLAKTAIDPTFRQPKPTVNPVGSALRKLVGHVR